MLQFNVCDVTMILETLTLTA